MAKTVRVFRRKASLEKKQDLLEKYQRALDTRVLLRLDSRALKSSCDISRLDRNIQDLVSALEQGHKSVKQIIEYNSQGIKDHIDRRLESQTQNLEALFARDKLLDSLIFPEIVSRQENVSAAYEGTCSWIFDSSADQQNAKRPWSNFRKWLETDDGVYWISGKPGSGKSTLMKYIANNETTSNLLGNWDENTDLLVVSFFFWNAGTALQKSYTGLLRSLLFQIATQWPALATLGEAHPGNVRGELEVSNQFLLEWTDQRLRSLLTRFLSQKPASVSLCVFIDGLDEFVGDEEQLLRLVDLFSKTSQCKVCVAGRPEQVFRQEFRHCPQLRVQDLNDEDMRRTVNQKLIPSLQKFNCKVTHDDHLASFVRDLVAKASGVFLWLDLMIAELIRGARNGDTMQMLESRLQRTPETIKGMYAHILKNLDPLYREETLKYFGILLAAPVFNVQLSLLDLVCAEGEAWDHVVGFHRDYFWTSDFESTCRRLETRLIASCGGLVNLQESLEDNGVKEQSCIKRERERKVEFLHRTALEYVQEQLTDGLMGPVSLLDANAYIARARIAMLVLSPLIHGRETVFEGRHGLAVSFPNTMFMISSIGFSEGIRLIDPSVSIQIDLADQAFQSLQNMYTFYHGLEQNVFNDIRFVRRIIDRRDSDCQDADFASWCPVKDRLSCAAYFGCHHYLHLQLSSQKVANERVGQLLQTLLSGVEDGWGLNNADVASFLAARSILQRQFDTEQLYRICPFDNTLTGFQYGTLWGAFFYLHLKTSIMKPVETASMLTAATIDAVERFLSLGANPNTRVVSSRQLPPGDLWVEESPLAMVETSLKSWPMAATLLSEIKIRLRSAGGVHSRRFLFHSIPLFKGTIKYEEYYSLRCLTRNQLERLNTIIGFQTLEEKYWEEVDAILEASRTSENKVTKEEVTNEVTRAKHF